MTTADVLLTDGSLAVIRTLAPGDAAALHDLHDRVSDESVRLRFFSLARRAAHAYVEHVLDFAGHVGARGRGPRPAGGSCHRRAARPPI